MAARGALITQAGGKISATGANGAVYTLELPAGALTAPTEIALYPVDSLANLPAGATLAAAVQFTPDGLQLQVPATLTIQLPSAADPAITGIIWHGDGVEMRRAPLTEDGQSATLEVEHFSGAGAWITPADWSAALACDQTDYVCQTDQAMDLMTIQRRTRTNLLGFLRTWYQDTVAPFIRAEQNQISGDAIAPSPDLADLGDDGLRLSLVYGGWLRAIDVARNWLRDSTFTVAPELADSRVQAKLILRDLFFGYNRACASSGTDVLRAITSADDGVGLHHLAERFGIATRASELDYQTLLDESCAQIIIDPRSTYTGTEPGDAGSVEVTVGYTIAGGPVITDGNIRVDATIPGSGHEFFATAQAGHYSQVIPWPTGVDPLHVDIRATLQTSDPALAEVGLNPTILTEIARSTTITKRAQDLFRFTFDVGLDGWEHSTVGDRATSVNWGEVDHETIRGNGVIHMDGRGRTSQAKSWIFKTFTLPESAKSFWFDVSAESIAGSSSSVRAEIGVVGELSILFPTTTVRNSRNRLSFTTRRVSISQWAGKEVTIYIEQGYNVIGGFDKEIYIDNVRITAT